MSKRDFNSASIKSDSQINDAEELLKMLPNKKRAILNEIDSNTMSLDEQMKTPNTTLKRSRSNPSLFTKDMLKLVEKPRTNITKTSNKVKTPVRDKTPITPFLTPQNMLRRDERTPTNHFHFSNNGTPTSLFSRTNEKHSRTPLKRFFSEMNLPKPMATPECFNKVSLETPRICLSRESDNYCAESSPIIVGVRIRPMNSREVLEPQISNAVTLNGNDVLVTCESGTSHKFSYDHCFTSTNPNHDEYANQEDIFTIMMQPLIDQIFEGYNACLFAYGQTGSGKTYSMLGEEIEVEEMGLSKGSGIIPRFCYELFERISSYSDIDINLTPTSRPKFDFEFKVEVSYFEIYNEKIHDLLDKSTEAKKTPLKVREHPLFGPYVVDLSTHIVNSFEEMLSWLKIGINQRMTAPTNMNEKSSRSHSIFSVILSQNQISEDKANYTKRSKINLIDLAGSERVSQMSSSRERIREGVSINRSLLTLGKVIAALSENSNSRKKSHVPYRDSVLTWLLRESLGGNSRTSLLATISPTHIHVDETLATLRYACQARDIVNHVRITEDPNERMIRDLKEEVEDLRAQNDNLKHQLTVKLKSPGTPSRLEEFPDSPSQSDEPNNLHSMTCASEIIQCEGLSVRLNLLNGCWLVNLGADPASSAMILYRLPEGQILLSREPVGDNQSQIILSGRSVHSQHCVISNNSGNLSVKPLSGDTWVNAKVIQEETLLHHGDRLVIGDHHYFRISIKHELLTNSENVNQPLADLAFAKDEIFSEIKNTYENKVSTAEMKIDELKKDNIIYEKKILTAETRINQFEKKNLNYENKISNAEKRINELENDNLNFENKISSAEMKINELEKDNLNYKNKIASAEIKINEFEKDYSNYENNISSAEKTIKELEKDNLNYKNKIASAEKRINELEKDNSNYENKISSTKMKINELEKDNLNYKNKIASAEIKINEFEKDYSNYENKISSAEMTIKELEKDNLNYKNKIASAEKRINELEKDNSNYENKISSTKMKINELEKNNLNYKNKLSSAEIKINELEKDNSNYANKISSAEMRINELEMGNTNHENTISIAEMRINELEKNNKDHVNKLEMQRTSYETQIKKLTSIMEEQNSKLSSIQKQKKRLLSECEMLKEELNTKSQKETIDILNISLPSYQSNFIEQIEAEFQTWFEEFIPLAKRFENENEMTELVLEAQQFIMYSNISLDISQQLYNEELHVKILDKNSGKSIYMKLERFRSWLPHFKESSINSIKELFENDISFEPRFCSSVLSAHDSDELMLSRISHLNQSSPIHSSLSSSRYSENSLDYSSRKSSESEANISYSHMRIHVEKLEGIAKSLMFCSCSKKIESIISCLMETVDNLKSALEVQIRSSEEYTTISSVSEISLRDSSLVLIPPMDIPKKSNLKAPYIHSSPNKKAVRFKFTQSQLES